MRGHGWRGLHRRWETAFFLSGLALLGAVLVGMLGMHALPNQGHLGPSETGFIFGHGIHQPAVVTSVPPGGASEGPAEDRRPDRNLSGMAACVVMLAAAGLGLLFLVRLIRRLPSGRVVRPAAIRVRPLRLWNPGMPVEWRFSVLRC